MDCLAVLVESVSAFGQLISRIDDKQHELAVLASSMRSISESVQTFAASLEPQEREETWRSNTVFPQLYNLLLKCHEIVEKGKGDQQRKDEGPAAAPQDSPQDCGAIQIRPIVWSVMRSSWAGTRRTLHEGMQMASEKLGGIGHLMGFPEDELAMIRQTAAELDKLVPQLQLAMQAYTLSWQKRTAEAAGLSPAAPHGGQKALALEVDGRPRRLSSSSLGNDNMTPEDLEKVPLLELQLVSESPTVQQEQLTRLTTRGLRRGSAASTASLDDIGGDGACCRVFGRQEIHNKVPPRLTVESDNGKVPIARVVSRDVFVLRLPPSQAVDSLMAETLCMFGGQDPLVADTLPMGPPMGSPRPAAPPPPQPLASAAALMGSGLHVKRAGETTWRWFAKDAAIDVYEGDCFAVCLELKQAGNQGRVVEPKDLESEDVRLLLGAQLQSPGQ